MAVKLNRIKNPDFSAGKSEPKAWVWSSDAGTSELTRGAAGGGVTMVLGGTCGNATMSQTVTVRPGRHYRVESTISCDLEAEAERGGMVLGVTAFGVEPADDPDAATLTTPPIRTTDAPTAVRTYYTVPAGVREVRVFVGVRGARGRATVHDVRFIGIIELDQDGHTLALPAPAYSVLPPKPVKTVLVCSRRAESRPLTLALRAYFGKTRVATADPATITKTDIHADAVVFPDDALPRRINSLGALRAVARDRIVVVSIPAFAAVSPADLNWRRIDQEDDPIHGKVAFANFATRGFALDDVFPYAWQGETAHSFAQRQFKPTSAFTAFCRKHGFETLLCSMCDQDKTSDRPISLIRTFDRGALVVLDINPVEVAGSTFSEPQLATHLLLSVLGQTVTGLGQFVTPYDNEALFRAALREMQVRFNGVAVHDADVPDDEVEEQMVTLGREDQSFGLPLKPKPAIIVRSGLSAGDMESVYGCLFWFKQLVRMAPYACPYVEPLASRFRVAWIPCAAPWEARGGFESSRRPPNYEAVIDLESGCRASMIDVVSSAANRIRVIVPNESESYARHFRWLPRLAESFVGGWGLVHQPEPGSHFADRGAFAWRKEPVPVSVETDANAFTSKACEDVLACGGKAIRIEVPGSSADFVAQSIHRTDLAATMLELVVGLEYGMIAVNRRPEKVRFDGFPPLGPGEALIIDDPNQLAKAKAS